MTISIRGRDDSTSGITNTSSGDVRLTNYTGEYTDFTDNDGNVGFDILDEMPSRNALGQTSTLTRELTVGSITYTITIADMKKIDPFNTLIHGAITITGGNFGGIVAPRIDSITRKSPTSIDTDADTLTWTVTFDRDVFGVDAADFNVEGTTAPITVDPDPNDADVYDVSVTGGDLADLVGTVTLTALAVGADNIEDEHGNDFTDTTPLNDNENFYILFDSNLPDVHITTTLDAAVADRLEPFGVTVTFHEDVCEFLAADISVTNATLSGFPTPCTDIDDLDAYQRVYEFTLTPTGTGDITIQVPENKARDASGNLNTASNVVTVSVMNVVAETQRYIAERLTARAERIMGGEDPGMIRDRLSASGGGQPGQVSIDGVLDRMDVAFETSMRSLSGYFSAPERLDGFGIGMGEDETGLSAGEGTGGFDTGFDFWTKGSYARTHTDSSTMDVWLVYAGLDYRFNDRLVLGILGQTDWTDETDSTDGTSFDATGWLAGPYISARLHDNLIFDGRVAWGRSSNDVNAIGYYTDSFDTTRWLGRAQMSGDFQIGAVALTPFTQIVYFEETQESYTDTPGNLIPEQTIEVGHLRFGPEIRGSFALGEELTLTPYGSVSGIWQFARPDDNVSLSGVSIDSDDLRARADAGIGLTTTGGWSIGIEGFYEPGGSDGAKSWGGSVLLRIPLGP